MSARVNPISDLQTIVLFSMTSEAFQQGIVTGTEDSVRGALAHALGISSDEVPQPYVDAFMPLGGEQNPTASVLVSMANDFSLQVLSN